VPTGKVYQVVLTATVQTIQVPYTCAIQVSGTTETWFEDPIQGHYNWSMPANIAFLGIGRHGGAGSDSASYSSNGPNGTVTVNGTLSAQQTVNFVANVYDVTDTYTSSDAPSNSTTPATTLAISQPVKRLATPGTPPVQGKLVQTIHF
jgi:hypothetical protein